MTAPRKSLKKIYVPENYNNQLALTTTASTFLVLLQYYSRPLYAVICASNSRSVIPVIPVAVPNEYGLGVKRVLTHGNPIYRFKMTINGILECVEALCRNYVIRQIIPGIYNSVAVEILTKV